MKKRRKEKEDNEREKRRKDKDDITIEKKHTETVNEEKFVISIRLLDYPDFTLNLTQVITDINKEKVSEQQLKNNLALWRKENLVRKS